MLKIIDPNIAAPDLDEKFPSEIRELCKGLLDKDESKRFDFEQLISYKIV